MPDANEQPESWAITERPISLPESVMRSDPAAAYSSLMKAHGELENRRDQEGRNAGKTLTELLTDLLGVLDALDRALVSAHERGESTTGSLTSTRRRLTKVLRRQGVEKVQQEGKPVDPDVSDIEGVEEHPEMPAETVVRETVAAYTWRHVILRRGSVIVSSGRQE